MMITWKNLDTISAYQELQKTEPVNLAEAMAGENGADRVKKYSVPMAAGLSFHYAAKQVDDEILSALAKLAEETQLAEKFEALYNGEMINTGEQRMVLHHMTRGQLGEAVVADGVDKRSFYVEQQKKIAELANNTFKMEAKFISNVDPDDAAAVLNTIDVAHSLFVLVSKSGTTLETLTNESFVKDALKNAGLDASRHSLWTIISEAGSPPPPAWVVRCCPWRLAPKYSHSSLRARRRKTGLHRTGTCWQILPCWTL